MKNAQISLEFIMTYGWALLALGMAITALAYFGVLNPADKAPNKCEFSSAFPCLGVQLTDTKVIAVLQNNLGQPITDVYIRIQKPDNTYIDCGAETEWYPGRNYNITCDTTTLPVPTGTLKARIEINYTKSRSTYPQVSIGEVYGKVR